jgi:regulatory protein
MKIKAVKKIGLKYKIILDNGESLETYDNVIINNNLLYDKEIDKDLYKKIIDDSIYYKHYNSALKMINRRLQSELEIRKYLRKSEISKDSENKIISSLITAGLINDRAYAIAYTNDKINLSSDGPYKIKKALEQNNIKEEYIEEALANIDQNIIRQHISKIINKQISTNNKNTPYALRQKIIIHLINLGYSKESILNELDKIEIKNPNLTKEMDKIFNKLKSKYEGYELYSKLKSKLYSKGFTSEEINEYINKSSSI